MARKISARLERNPETAIEKFFQNSSTRIAVFGLNNGFCKLPRLEIVAAMIVGCCAMTACPSRQQAKRDVKPPERRCCVTDPQAWYSDTEEHIRKRFDIYKANGVDMLRAEIDWSLAEPEEGKWRSDEICRYLKIAKEYGFRIKLIIGTMMSPPGWYLQKHSDATRWQYC